MKIVTKNIEFDLFGSNFLTPEVVDLLKTSNKIYLIPQSLYQHLKLKVDNDITLNTSKYWISCLDLYSSILQGINSSKHLKSINWEYNIIIEEWQSNNILSNQRGSFSRDKGITFTYEFKETNSYCLISIIEDDKVIKESIDVKLDSYYKKTLLNCDIDVDKAIYDEYMNKESISIFVKRISLIFNFLGRRYIKKGKRVNRWYNSFSSLTSTSRKYVKIDGKYFYEMDLSNAQPSLLCKYLMDNYDNFDEKYIEMTSNGKFYESIMDLAKEMGIEGEKTYDRDLGCQTFKSFSNRDHVKTLCYQNIFFGQNTSTKTFELFAKLYPNTWRLLSYELNSGDEKLAGILQNMEANIFLNIKPKCNYFTVHDAIYISDKSFKGYVDNKVKELMGTDKFILGSNFEEQDSKRVNYNISIDKEVPSTIFIIEDVNRKPKNSIKNDIKILLEKGLKSDQIIEELGISRKTFYKWKKELR